MMKNVRIGMFILRNNAMTPDVVFPRKEIERYPARSLCYIQNLKLMKRGPGEVLYFTHCIEYVIRMSIIMDIFQLRVISKHYVQNFMLIFNTL